MPDEIKRIDFYYASVPDKPSEGARILATLTRCRRQPSRGLSIPTWRRPIPIGAYPGGQRHMLKGRKNCRAQVEHQEKHISQPEST
jgi:hypothetical protein